jgi:hypothetical protein
MGRERTIQRPGIPIDIWEAGETRDTLNRCADAHIACNVSIPSFVVVGTRQVAALFGKMSQPRNSQCQIA